MRLERHEEVTMADELSVKFWGARGSYPTPGGQTVKYGGNTACVEVRAGDRTLILDAGTGIIPLGRDLAHRARSAGSSLELALLFSHLHHDHTQGFPFFVPAFMPLAHLHIFGPGDTAGMLERVLEGNQSPQTFPVSLREMASAKTIRSIRETEAVIWDEQGIRVSESGIQPNEEAVVVRLYHSHAHPGGVYVYRIAWRGRSVVYATDTEGYIGTDRRLVQFARGGDLLIHDAQYTEEHYAGQMAGFPSTQGYGHSTVAMACEAARAAEVDQLVLFHHDPAYNDDMLAKNEAHARTLFPASDLAREGLQVVLHAPRVRTSGSEQVTNRAGRDVKYAQNG
jgi:phosphoribosyl 1,2-cyclic phosphodiesterase